MPATNVKQISCYVTPEQHKQLKLLHEKTRVPVNVYLREAIDDLLKKYKKELSK